MPIKYKDFIETSSDTYIRSCKVPTDAISRLILHCLGLVVEL